MELNIIYLFSPTNLFLHLSYNSRVTKRKIWEELLMDNTLVKLAKTYSNRLIEQIYFMELIKETVAELGGNHNE